jgi:pimeloyl-ACP methyl ester carboxylesterase
LQFVILKGTPQAGATMTPVVFIPGHLCTSAIYAPQIGSLGDRSVMVADTTQDDSIAGMADRLLAAAPDRFVLAGLSMGGMIAMEVMARAPERVAGAMLMDTDPNAARDKENAYREGVVARVRTEGLMSFVDQFTPRLYGHSQEATDRLLPPAREMMGAMPVEVFHRQSTALMTRRDMLPLIERFENPVTVLVGEKDVICPPVLHKVLADALPIAVLVEVPGAGHIPTLESAAVVTQALHDLLARVDAG